ncbi:uncharacterized protein LOC127255452 isoform X2 [Andrographis paniculata]|nr:uncharacterized protein LOC127255452 isoform X2 [Andrographis paniculata]
MVSTKVVRPCPPVGQGGENFNAGDVVEVFYDDIWMAGKVLKVVEKKRRQWMVRLPGCTRMREAIVDRSQIRMRSIRRDGKWITPNAKSFIVSTRSLKWMSPYGSSIIEASNRHVQKLQAIEKDDRRTARKIFCDNSDSDGASVGSCSVADRNRENSYVPFTPQARRESDGACSDTESCSNPIASFRFKEDVEVNVRLLEIDAYRRTLEALYALGPLSWEREKLLTDLRIFLGISNDEHMAELRHLRSENDRKHFRSFAR